MPINSKRKGAAGEREFAAYLCSHGIDAYRGCQRSGSPDSPDVVAKLPGFHFEVKRQEKLRLYDAMCQAREDGGAINIPVVAHRRNREPWMITFLAQDIVPIMKFMSLLWEDTKKWKEIGDGKSWVWLNPENIPKELS